MTRAALYARYSDDKQSEASIEDQFRLCREHTARERWQIVGSYEDAAISGASTILRPGIPAADARCAVGRVQHPRGRGAGPDQPRPGGCRHALQAFEVRGCEHRHLGRG
ncbi:recombinase family protein [Paracoccus binzhouensis]|uniref:recombinase family protein n=1 Tax=Paracoccus binzhouensis TaxID=2796149 RepID=UPI002FCE48F1